MKLSVGSNHQLESSLPCADNPQRNRLLEMKRQVVNPDENGAAASSVQTQIGFDSCSIWCCISFWFVLHIEAFAANVGAAS
jgi:hypothetical protein